MSTRGKFGLERGGVCKVIWNAHDSYPDGLGASMAGFCRLETVENLNRIFDNMIMVDCRDEVSEEAFEWAVRHHFVSATTPRKTMSYEDIQAVVAPQPLDLRRATDEPFYFADGSRYMDADYCYIANLSRNQLDYYAYPKRNPDWGQPPQLMRSFDLADLSADVIDQMNEAR